jgi:SAM-dependent methyltransferase
MGRFAEAYTAEAETGLINAYYNRPAIVALAGDVAGRRILDAGCGSGSLMAALCDQGAIVTGFDKSAAMLNLVRRRLGGDADLQVADLGSPLPFPNGMFDDVIASLVLHYLKDWGPALAELRRVPGSLDAGGSCERAGLDFLVARGRPQHPVGMTRGGAYASRARRPRREDQAGGREAENAEKRTGLLHDPDSFPLRENVPARPTYGSGRSLP